MPTFNVPDDHDRAELAGRMCEAIDIETAIRAGRFGSLDELADWLAEQSDLMNRVQACDLWLMSVDQPECLDLQRTVDRSQRPERSRV